MRIVTSIFIATIAATISVPHRATAQTTQPNVLAELFCNINCGSCPGPDTLYDQYVSNHPNVAVIKYHNATTDNQDPFYLASLPFSQQRDVFYGGSGGQSDPSAYIDGISTGSASEGIWETYSNLAAQGNTAPINPTVSYGPSGIDTISFTVTGGSSVLVNAYVAIKESQIYYANVKDYGPTPGNLWNNIFRTMLTPEGGTNFNFSGSHTFRVIYDPSQYDGKYTPNMQNVTAVLFVQDAKATTPSNNNSHQIEAIGQVSLASPSAVSEVTATSNQLIFPENPLPANGQFRVKLANAGNTQVSIYDLLGRKVRTLVHGTLPAGETTVDLNGASLPTGVYVAQLITDGRTVDQKKFMTP